MKNFKTLFSSESTEWLTPIELFQDIKDAFSIELDPCAHDTEHLPVRLSLTRKDDGLAHEWNHNTFINPPYSDISVWIDKTIISHEKYHERCYVILLPSRTDRPWFHRVLGKASAVCFMSKRIRFSNAKNNAPFPSLIAVFKNDGFEDNQMAVFDKYGYTI